MKGILIFAVALVWGSLSGQFLLRVVTAYVLTAVSMTGIVFSKVSKGINVAGALAGFAQSIMYGRLFLSDNWVTSKYIVNYGTWNAASIAALLSFVVTIIYVSPQVPGKVLLARMCAWLPGFMEAQMHEPRTERVAFARKWRDRAAVFDR